MKRTILLLAAAISVALGLSPANAQHIFVDGDIVRGNQPGAPGPICVLNSQFKHLEKVVFRFRVHDRDGNLLDQKGLKSLVVEFPDGTKIDGHYHGSPPNAPTDYFWVAVWIVPASYPSGTFTYKAVATDMNGHSQTWEPIKRVTSWPLILPEAIEFAKQ